MERTVALDLDGTLIDCQHRQVEVLRSVAPWLGADKLNEIWRLKRNGQSTIDALLSIGSSQEQALSASRRWREIIEEPFWLSLDALFEGVRESMKLMRSNGMKLCLLTARGQPHWLAQQLQKLGLNEYLDAINVVKPENASSSKARILASLRPVAMIGDSESDGLAAKTSSTRFIAVETGQRSREFLAGKGFTDCESSFESVASRLVGLRDV